VTLNASEDSGVSAGVIAGASVGAFVGIAIAAVVVAKVVRSAGAAPHSLDDDQRTFTESGVDMTNLEMLLNPAEDAKPFTL
jgi:predicted acylesterase/phospholipase RssA